MRGRPTIHTDEMLVVTQDVCATLSALCFYIPHTQWENKEWCVGFGNFELTGSIH